MNSDDQQRFTLCLQRYADGDRDALDELMPRIYDELRRLADGVFRRQSPVTIQPTILVHEAYIRLAGAAQGLSDKQHFLAVAAKAMRQVLANHVRDSGAQKRGGAWQRVSLHEEAVGWARGDVDLEALHEALCELEKAAPRRAEVAQLRFFSGMTIDETAAALGVATSTVEADWAVARAWLRRRLADDDGGS
ncbi:MAG: ECF-type sigma factor [Planctomycetota bacterium]